MSLVTYEEVGRGCARFERRVAARQMPPWHIDCTVGIQSFKNDRSLTDDEVEVVIVVDRRGRAEGRPEGHPGRRSSSPTDDVWNFTGLFGGPPDLVVKSTPYTMPALAQDHWWKPEVQTGLTEDRWICGIEIRPSRSPAAASPTTR